MAGLKVTSETVDNRVCQAGFQSVAAILVLRFASSFSLPESNITVKHSRSSLLVLLRKHRHAMNELLLGLFAFTIRKLNKVCCLSFLMRIFHLLLTGTKPGLVDQKAKLIIFFTNNTLFFCPFEMHFRIKTHMSEVCV